MENNINEENKTIELSYMLALKSYDWAMQRWEALDSRLEKLIAWITAINLVIVSIIANKLKPEFLNLYLLYIVGVLFLITIISLYFIRKYGHLKLISPTIINDQYLKYSELGYKKSIIYWAGEHFKYNKSCINRKDKLSTIPVLFFFSEILLLIIWSIQFIKI